ncbi:uncharacterized protein LOC122055125 [Zingiber officinale]|uniref:uncharacterized protein LOC122055125 n=1 Tax=Zingiber officinale TaxID=94328 RepID=UPI001C4D9365|nr:uncharacterized protein LOC122055125 [Zingiber officinale]
MVLGGTLGRISSEQCRAYSRAVDSGLEGTLHAVGGTLNGLLKEDSSSSFNRTRNRNLPSVLCSKNDPTKLGLPQSNGQAEVTNQEILICLRTWLGHAGGSWVDELSSVLWALRTTPKEATGVTPFQLVYEGEAVVPVEVGVESDRCNSTMKCRMELDLVDEVQDKAVIRLMAYR